MKTLSELLLSHRETQADKLAFAFLGADGQQTGWTYAQLVEQVQIFAGHIALHARPGDRVALLYPSSLAAVAAVLGCFQAGAVAVFAALPNRNRSAKPLANILRDAQPTLALTCGEALEQIAPGLADSPEWAALRVVNTDLLDPAVRLVDPVARPDDLALLQYTSGSTRQPKGVMLTHGNLSANLHGIRETFDLEEPPTSVFWLPLYHDMGLIGGAFSSMSRGGTTHLMSPSTFVQQPLRWLRTISETRAGFSGGPDFAYDLCVRRATDAAIAELDLSCWKLAFSGAEPIKAATLERFAERFAPCGFQRTAFFPCYGLAEASLLVTAGRPTDGSMVSLADCPAGLGLEGQTPDDEAAGSDRARRRIVGCGRPNAWQKVRVVDPLTQLECEAGEPGEIWVHGPSVAKGYWNAPVETERTFNGRLADLSPDNGESLAYLRTGDLGFYRDGELFVVDRIKDLIVVNGRNVSPQDVEWAAREADPTVQTAAAFAVATESGERPALAVELVRRGACEPEQFFATLRRSVASLCEVELQGIVLLPPGALPRTTSGKVRRSACRQAFLSRDLKEFARWEAPLAPAAMRASADPLEPRPGPSAGELRDWLIGRVAARLGTPAKAIDPQAAFLTLGLDSVEAMSLSGELEEHLGRRLSPVLFYNYPTIASLAEKLAEAPKTACRSGATTPSAATAPHGSYAPPATNASTPASSPAAASASAAPAGTPSNGADDGQMLREVQAMSDAEIEAMIADLSQKSLQQNW